MVITSHQPGFTTSMYNSVWGVARRLQSANPNDRTVDNSQTSQRNDVSSTVGQNPPLSSWRVRRFASKAGIVALFAALAFAPSVSSRAACSPATLLRPSSQWKNIEVQDTPLGSNIGLFDLATSSLSSTRLDSMFTPFLQEQQNSVLAEKTDQSGLINGMNLAQQPLEPTSQEVIMSKAIYPADLMKEYKVLVRKKHLGMLPVREQKRLAELREKIQTLSHQDEKSQSAVRQVKEVNASLSSLKTKITARIAQRKAEKQEVKRDA